jgi:hypothetical protein
MRFSGGGQKTLNMEWTANPAVHCNRRVGLLPVFGMLSHGALRVRKLHIETEPSRRNKSAGPPLPLITKKIPPTNIKPPPTPQNIATYGLGNDHCKSLKIRFMIDAPNCDYATAGSYIEAGDRPCLFCVSCSFSSITSHTSPEYATAGSYITSMKCSLGMLVLCRNLSRASRCGTRRSHGSRGHGSGSASPDLWRTGGPAEWLRLASRSTDNRFRLKALPPGQGWPCWAQV